MERALVLFVILNLWTTSLALQCEVVQGSLKQIDVGDGQVFGVNLNNQIFTRYSGVWMNVPGSLKHVSVGPAGVWGVNANNYIFRLVKGDWVIVPGLLTEIDAGGFSPAGVNMNYAIFCLQGGNGGSWTNIPGLLKYYSCGPYSCWGVNSADVIFIMKNVTQTACVGSMNWQQISGSLSMIEVSTDGKVYGVNSSGGVFTRDGISPSNPAGTVWRQIEFPQSARHVSYDLGHLWVIGTDYSIYDCTE